MQRRVRLTRCRTWARGAGFPRSIDSAVDLGAFESPAAGAHFGIGGRVFGARLLKGTTLVVLTDLTTSEKRYRPVNPSGIYRFRDLAFGESVKIEAISKSVTYPAQTLVVPGEIGDLNFAAAPSLP